MSAQILFRGWNLGVIRTAALLVPRRQRAEWVKEWRAELWHVRQSCAASPAGERAVAAFCYGAFADALCLRRGCAAKRIATRGSAMQCLLALVGAAVVTCGLALQLPGVRAQLRSSEYRLPAGLSLIQSARFRESAVATVSFDQYRGWAGQRRLFADSAFYRIDQAAVGAKGSWAVAHTSQNLVELLDLPVRMAPTSYGEMPTLILSDKLWRKQFGADHAVVGRMVRVGLVQAKVGGVAAAYSWKLPGRVDAWLLEPDAELAGSGSGFVVARLSPKAAREWYGAGRHTFAHLPDGSLEDLRYDLLTERTQGPWGTLLFAIFLAFLALPATTPLSLGEYRLPAREVGWGSAVRRWGFLVCKIALLLMIASALSLDLAYLRTTFDWRTSEYLELLSAFSTCLLGLRWTLRDQRQRCPVCLRKLTHPARVGQPSRNFLAWNGTELMCAGGHGLLHVPEMSTSWFSTQRWLHLDGSWDVLFAE